MILQFGTSRFLQAHVDLFAWEARLAGQTVADIAIVQVSDDPVRAKRLAAFNDESGFPVVLKGLEAGQAIERRIVVRSVRHGFAAARDWDALRTLFVDRVTHVVSNSGDNGFYIPAEDRVPRVADKAPRSFCGIIVALLHLRWQAGKPGVTFLPCELAASNGATLRGHVIDLATTLGLEAQFLDWLGSACTWVNTLVDRIVSEPLEPAGAVAEPYALWAIEGGEGLDLPFTHPAIIVTDDLARYERLKLHILNLGHSWMAERWHDAGAVPGVTVKDVMSDQASLGDLRRLYAEEVVPVFEEHGLGEAARDYVETTLDRFANPFLEHRLADIFGGHEAKVKKRIGGFVAWADESAHVLPMPQLRALAMRYGLES
jgi:tagaturonate reductase